MGGSLANHTTVPIGIFGVLAAAGEGLESKASAGAGVGEGLVEPSRARDGDVLSRLGQTEIGESGSD